MTFWLCITADGTTPWAAPSADSTEAAQRALAEERFDEAEHLFSKAVQAAESNGGARAPLVRGLIGLARTKIELADFPGAETLLRRADTLTRGRDTLTLERADAMQTLGALYLGINRLSEGRLLCDAALRATDSSTTGTRATALALACLALSDRLQAVDKNSARLARERLERALLLAEGERDITALERTRIRNQLAGTLSALDETDESIRLINQSIDECRVAIGEKSYCVAASVEKLAIAYVIQQQPDDALAELEPALLVTEIRLGRQHPATGRLLNAMGLALLVAGEWQDAIDVLDQAYAIFVRYFGENDLTVGEILDRRGTAKFVLRRTQDGDDDFARLVAIRKAIYGPQHDTIERALTKWSQLRRMASERQPPDTTRQ